MTRIKVPIDVLLSVSDQFDNASNQLKMINENLLRQIFMLMSNWYGQRGTAFQTDFKTAYEQMNVTIERMHVISQQLKGIAVRFMDADQLQDFMGEQRMELFAKLSTTNYISAPPKSFIDQVGDTAKDLAGGLKKGLGSVVESLKDTGTAIVKNPIGTLGDMAYNATVGTAEDVIGFAAWGKNMVMDEGEREAFIKEIQVKADESGKANFVGEQAGVMLGSFLVSRLGIKAGPNHNPDTGGDGGNSKQNVGGAVQHPSNFADRVKLESHYDKHGGEFGGIYKSANEYLDGAKDVINNGVKVQYEYKDEIRTGYVRFMGNNKDGNAKFEFVGTNNNNEITTYHTQSGKKFWKTINGENISVINPSE